MENFEGLSQQVKFQQGWKTKLLLGNKKVAVQFDSKSENEKINHQQFSAYEWLVSNWDGLIKKGSKQINEYVSEIQDDIIPYLTSGESISDLTTLIKMNKVEILTDGTVAILYDNVWDESGVAIMRLVNGIVKVGPQSIIWD